MPQQRHLVAASGRWCLEVVRRHAAPRGWSPAYQAPVARFALPGRGALALRSGSDQLLLDALSVVELPPRIDYRLEPLGGGDSTWNVLSDNETAVAARPGAWLLPPAAILAFRRLCRDVQCGALELESAAASIRGLRQHGRPIPAGLPAQVERARRLLSDEQHLPDGLGAVADAAGCSVFYLERLFRRHLGASVHQYRLRARVASAIARIDEGERDLAGLAHELGFCSQSHLGDVFRRLTGTSPAQARRALAR